MYLKAVIDHYANFMYVCLELNYVALVVEYRYANIYKQSMQLFSRRDKSLFCVQRFIVLR